MRRNRMRRQTIRKKRNTAYLNQRHKRFYEYFQKEFTKRITERMMNAILCGETE